MPPERVYIAVSLVIGLTVNTFETVWIQFVLLDF